MEPTHHVRVLSSGDVSGSPAKRGAEPMEAKIDEYRASAFACEKKAKEAADRTIKLQWEELAMQWHSMANQAARLLDMLQPLK
jgi:hypothetical protein